MPASSSKPRGVCVTIALGVSALLWLAVVAASFRVYFRLGRLPPVAEVPKELPRVAVVVPARNEEAGIEASVRSLLAQEGVALDLVVVNDGSTDATRAILERLSAERPELKLVHDPPVLPGWLGKVNALHHGVAQVSGEWLLFADADVVHHPRALASAIAAAEREGKDLVALLPRFEWHGVVEHGLMVAFTIVLVQFGSPHLEDPAFPEEAIGSGSFTLVRRSVYERAGGHEPLKATVLDDVRLGRLVKRAGGRVALRLAPELVRIRMYRGDREAFWGLSKNLVASVDNRVPVALVFAAAIAWLMLAPLAALAFGLLAGDLPLACAGLGVYLLELLSLAAMRGWHRYRWWVLPAFPVFAFTVVACALVGSYRGAHQGVVRWRGREVKL
jgi:GT2 family glycosyltransferase